MIQQIVYDGQNTSLVENDLWKNVFISDRSTADPVYHLIPYYSSRNPCHVSIASLTN